MHEYGLPSNHNNESAKDMIIDEEDIIEYDMDDFSELTGSHKKNKYVSMIGGTFPFEPLDVSSVRNKYIGEKLILNEAMSSTKIYTTQNA
jgi:hypothetical protein